MKMGLPHPCSAPGRGCRKGRGKGAPIVSSLEQLDRGYSCSPVNAVSLQPGHVCEWGREEKPQPRCIGEVKPRRGASLIIWRTAAGQEER